MKKRVVLLLTCLFLWVSSIFAQDVPVGVVVAFKKGNSQELNRYLGDKVDLIIHNRTTHAAHVLDRKSTRLNSSHIL